MSPTETDVEKIPADPSVSNSRWPRWWARLLLLFCVGGLSGLVARSYLFSRPSPPDALAGEVIESLPQARFSPEEVVQAQVESMRQAVDDPAALLTCYSFASPSNRQLTGPFERFAGLVSTEPYRQLGLCQDFQVGSAVTDGPTAMVLVSTLAEDGQGLAFMFVLSKQQDQPYQDCWMTDGVFPLLQQQSEVGQPEIEQAGQGQIEQLPQIDPLLDPRPVPDAEAAAL